ncbi:GntR family transcriptional regulator [Roseomonas sp. ACRSG]|nr:GntR family transcriptional regulator [Roseomonas sp. ACRSG]
MDLTATMSLHPPSLAQAVRGQLMRMIAQGALRPGGRLNEVHLAERFGISRGPVREAARELEGAGVLVSRPRQGFYVVNFTPAEIRDIYETKNWLEDAFITDLAAHLPMAARQEILADIDSIDVSERENFGESLLQFRRRVCGQLRNRFLAELMAALYRKFYVISAVVPVTDNAVRQEWILAVLRRFWAAMIAGDAAAARAVMAEDTAHWLADLPQRFAEVLQRPAPGHAARLGQ